MNEKKSLIDIKQNPLDLFDEWFAEAKLKEIKDPNAMNLATVSYDLQPNSRMVLLKSFNINGFVFYTNLNSKKASAIKNNSKVALNFYWKSTQRQVCVQGNAIIISHQEADKYFWVYFKFCRFFTKKPTKFQNFQSSQVKFLKEPVYMPYVKY